MDRWQNKVAVVTGASAGIGSACCKYLVARGMVVVGLARREQRLEQLKSELPADQQSRFHYRKCDVSVENDIVQTFAWIEKKFGGTDVLINNAGILRSTQIVAESNTSDLKAILDTNVLGVALCTREAFRSMKKRNFDGHVILINSILGHSVPIVSRLSFNMYPPSKHAITAMTEILRQEFMLNETKIKITVG